MNTPPLRNGTTAAVSLIPYFDLDASSVVITIIKVRCSVGHNGKIVRLGTAEVRLIDEPWDEGELETSSIRYPSDLSLTKPSTDVVVVGSAMAPGRVQVRELDVTVRVGSMEKALRVFGPRIWNRGVVGLTMTKPEPFEALPLQWEYAYGGSDFTEGEPPLEEPRNPVGRGVARSSDSLVNELAPQIEDPRDPIRNHRTRPAPAGVAAIGRHWEPRRRYLGTVDERWMQERMPLLPVDHDPRFNQVATPELICPQPLRGGEPIQVLNMNADGPLEFRLPMIRFGVRSFTSQHGEREHRPMLDTVLIEPNEREFEMVWRAIVPLPRRSRDIDSIQVYEKQVGGLP